MTPLMLKCINTLFDKSFVKRQFLSENGYNESLLKSKRFEYVCINFEDRLITIKDKKKDQIVEIRLVNIGSKHWRLSCSCKCSKCENGDCDHSVFALYSPAIGILRDLYFRTPNDILQVPCRIQNRFRFDYILTKMVVPLLMIWLFAMQIIPVKYDSTLETFRTTLSLLLGLMPIVPSPIPS
jgi:hypothetical protein